MRDNPGIRTGGESNLQEPGSWVYHNHILTFPLWLFEEEKKKKKRNWRGEIQQVAPPR